jgi:hypothetical protein
MSDHANMKERDVDRLFQGRAAACSAQDAGIEAFFADLRASQAEVSTEHCEQGHLSAMIREAHLITDKGEPVARPASKAIGPAVQASGLPKWRESVMAKFSGLTIGARIAAAATLLVFAFTGVAVAGGLPRPVQHAVSHAASVIGVSIPDPEDANEIEAPEVEDVQDHDDATEIDSNDQVQQPVSGEEAEDVQDDQDEAAGESHDGAKADADDDADDHDDAEEARSQDDRDEDQAVAPRESDSGDHESDDSEESEAGADD